MNLPRKRIFTESYTIKFHGNITGLNTLAEDLGNDGVVFIFIPCRCLVLDEFSKKNGVRSLNSGLSFQSGFQGIVNAFSRLISLCVWDDGDDGKLELMTLQRTFPLLCHVFKRAV